jgi:hypothetical protein
MPALPRGTGPVVIDGRTAYALFIRLPWGLWLRVDEWRACDGPRVSAAIPPHPAAPYYVHAATWVDGAGYWVELVDAPALPAQPCGRPAGRGTNRPVRSTCSALA